MLRRFSVKKELSCLLLAALALAACAAPTKRFDPAKDRMMGASGGDFTFIVLGDSRPDGSKTDKAIQPEAFLTNIKRANTYEHDFVVDIGDLVLGYCEPDLLVREWDAFDATIQSFEKPLVMVIGNHDVWNPDSEKTWLKRYGPLWFSWDHKSCHFISLDSDKIGELDRITGEQLVWLKGDLEKARDARRIFVFLHKPLWAYDNNQWNREVHPLLAKYGVDTVFAGHWHEYCLHPERDGIKYVVTGGGGAEIGDGISDFHHFCLVSVSGRASSFKVITPEKELPAEVVTLDVLRKIKDSLVIRPVGKLAKGGSTALTLDISNPMDVTATGSVSLDGARTSWKSVRKDVSVAPGEEAVLKLETVVTGNLFPLPRCRVDIKAGKTRMHQREFFPDVSALTSDLPSRPMDDFEDGDLYNSCGTNGITESNETWEAKCDTFGESTIGEPQVETVLVEGRESRVVRVKGVMGKSQDPKWCWAALESWVGGQGRGVDLRPSVGISFKARSEHGNGVRFMVEGTVAGKNLVAKGAGYCRNVKIAKEWSAYTFYWHELKQEPWICPGPDCVEGPLTVDRIEYFSWGIRDEGTPFDLMLDDVSLIYEKK